MAVAALSPWPTTPAATAAAVACLGAEIGATDERVGQLGATAAALVERHAPAAPQPIKNEAVIRCAGWLCQQPAGSVRSERVGDLSTGYSPAMLSALRHSGAAALLAPWRVRRAGSIE